MTNNLITLSEALDYCGSVTGKRPSPSTISRWYLKGVAGVKLRTALINGDRYTKIEWLESFFIDSAEAKSSRSGKKVREGQRRSKLEKLKAQAAEVLA